MGRDIAAATMIRSHRPLGDPFYRNEVLWYNPLTPALVAAVSAVSRAPIGLLYIRLGPYVNLLAPITFFVMLWRLFGPQAALFGVAGFVFFVPNDGDAILCATYSPRLMPVHFVQALFYLALVALHRAIQFPTTRALQAAGLFCGLVFLGHTAPFLILAVSAVMGALVVAPLSRRAAVTSLAGYFGVAALVGAPFWLPVAWRYHFVVRNPLPMVWGASEMDLGNLGQLLRARPLSSPVSLLMLLGLGWLAWRAFGRPREAAARMTIAAATTSFLAIVYSYVAQYFRLRGRELPALVPAFHFLYYLGAIGAVCFGLGCAWISGVASRSLDLLTGNRRLAGWLPAVVGTAAILLAIGRQIDSYATRFDFVDNRQGALGMFTAPGLLEMHRWIGASTNEQDVFLASDSLGLSVIATSGRKVVAVESFFSNPYVDWTRRHQDRDEMDAHLQAGDGRRFAELARHYRVRYVATDRHLAPEALRACELVRVWQSHDWTIYRVGA